MMNSLPDNCWKDISAKFLFWNYQVNVESAFEVMELLETDKADILFADIDMPDLNGIDFIKTLKNGPEVILTTAYSEYGIESYHLDVVDYLLKPILFDRFIKSVSKAKDLISYKRSYSNVELKEEVLQISSKPDKEKEDFIFVKTGSQKITRIDLNSIIYIESLHEYIRIHIKNEKYVIYFSLKNLFDYLPTQKFIQIHRSYIVNFDKIDFIEGNILKVGHTELKIGKNYREELLIRVKESGVGMEKQTKKVKV